MNIENLKKILESEREEYIKRFDKWNHNEALKKNEYLTGSKDMENILLPLLQKAVEMAEFYGDKWSYEPFEDKCEAEIHYDQGKKAREFLADFTKLTEIKKEGE